MKRTTIAPPGEFVYFSKIPSDLLGMVIADDYCSTYYVVTSIETRMDDYCICIAIQLVGSECYFESGIRAKLPGHWRHER